MPQNIWQNLAKASDSWRFRAELVRTVDLLHRDERPKLGQPATEQVAIDGRALWLQLEQVAAAA
eukprot:14798928-Alexandrium_andersonii.AAC.1